MYSYYSCRIDDDAAIRRCLATFLRMRRYHGLFSFTPETMTCVEHEDIPVLEKYEPFGLVMFKSGGNIGVPRFVVRDLYDLYKKIVDPIKNELRYAGQCYYIPVRCLRDGFGI